MKDDSTSRFDTFALLQRWLPKHALSALMHRLARSRHAVVRRTLIRAVLGAYPAIDMSEAEQPDPYAYDSFNAFFTRALRPGARPVTADPAAIVSPVDGTVSQLGRMTSGTMVQAKGRHYTVEALLADPEAALRYADGHYACIYLAPYNYHRIHMPCDARLLRTRYVPGALYSVNARTASAVDGLFALNERVVCEFDTSYGALALVMVGALFVGSIETVYAGEINPPGAGRGDARTVDRGTGLELKRGSELGRFNMGSTVILVGAATAPGFDGALRPGSTVRMGQTLAAPRRP